MSRRTPGFLSTLILLAVLGPAQTPEPSRYLEIQLPPGVRSETFFIRYSLAGVDFNSWAPPRTGVTSYVIHTTANGRSATGIKAVLYSPGCAIRTLDLAVTPFDNPRYSFVCQPVRNMEIHGSLDRVGMLSQRDTPHNANDATLRARYVARWAQAFLGVDDTISTTFPVGDPAVFTADGFFSLTVPDLSQDPLAGAPDHPGEFLLSVITKDTGVPIAQLVPASPQFAKTKSGGLPIQKEYPSEIEFAMRVADCPYLHDSEGFAIRAICGL